MSIPALLLPLALLAGLGPAIGSQQWDWEYDVETVFEPNAKDHIVELANAQRSSEGSTRFWCALEAGTQARVTQHFAFTNSIEQAHLQAHSLYAANFSKDIYGQASLWASKDGLTWSRLLNIPRPGIPTVNLTYDGLLPPSLTGGQDLWIQARLVSYDWSHAARFLQASQNQSDQPAFSLRIEFADAPASTHVAPSPSSARRAVASANISQGKLTEITLLDPGQGYSTPPVLRVLGTTGTGAVLEADLADGRVEGIRIRKPGRDYDYPIRLFISAPAYSAVPTVPGDSYQMYSTTDLLEWQPEGNAFTATGTNLIQEFEIDDEGRIYQICHLLDSTTAQ
ncbi:MAG: hypothetical protein RI897_1050 [Verrucomicrobiota bacterium]